MSALNESVNLALELGKLWNAFKKFMKFLGMREKILKEFLLRRIFKRFFMQILEKF